MGVNWEGVLQLLCRRARVTNTPPCQIKENRKRVKKYWWKTFGDQILHQTERVLLNLMWNWQRILTVFFRATMALNICNWEGFPFQSWRRSEGKWPCLICLFSTMWCQPCARPPKISTSTWCYSSPSLPTPPTISPGKLKLLFSSAFWWTQYIHSGSLYQLWRTLMCFWTVRTRPLPSMMVLAHRG